MRRLENQSFLLLLVAVTLAFGWILAPFYGAILWAIVVAVIFAPLNRRLQSRMGGRPNLAAAATVLIVIAMVILPLALITASLLQEATGLYAKVQSGEYNFGRLLQRVFDALPAWATGLLDRFSLTDLAGGARQPDGRAREGRTGGGAAGAEHRHEHVRLHDRPRHHAVPAVFPAARRQGAGGADQAGRSARADQKAALFGRFAVVVRATVKGSILVAMAQGALGGLAFWVLGIHAPLLWGVLMAFLSLLPAIGAGAGLGARCDLPAGHRRRLAGRRPDRFRGAGHRPGGQCAAPVPGRQGHQDAGLRRADLHAGRHPGVRPQRLCHRPGDRGDVRGDLGNPRRIEVCVAKISERDGLANGSRRASGRCRSVAW